MVYSVADGCTLCTEHHSFKPRRTWVVKGNLTIKTVPDSHVTEMVQKFLQLQEPDPDPELTKAIDAFNHMLTAAELDSPTETAREHVGVFGSTFTLLLVIGLAIAATVYFHRQLRDVFYSVQEATLDRAADLFPLKPLADADAVAYSVSHGVPVAMKRRHEDTYA